MAITAPIVPIGEISQQTYENRYSSLNSFSGLVVNQYASRYYNNGGIAPQVTGYLLSISPEQYDEYRQKGYAGDEKIGAAGLDILGRLRSEPQANSSNPARIRLVMPERNVGRHANFRHTFEACRGEYIALLEGDDLWTRPDKLQRQADLLDRHPLLEDGYPVRPLQPLMPQLPRPLQDQIVVAARRPPPTANVA